jgi:hypothetical protein
MAHSWDEDKRENPWIWATVGGRLQTAERDAATIGAGTMSISSLFLQMEQRIETPLETV